MKKQTIKIAAACAVAAIMLAQTARAQALDLLNPPLQVQAQAQAKKKTIKQKSAGSKAKFLPSSQETTKERSARLKRECQGAVNAGACSGYTR